MNSPSNHQKTISFAKGWLIWGCAALFYCYQFIMRVSPNIMADDLMAAFHIDACTLGIVSGFYYYTYSGFQIPGGTLLDKFKPRRVLAVAIILCSSGTLLFSFAESIYVASFSRAIIGAGSALGFISCFKIGSLWFPAHRLSLIVGLTLTLGTLGAVSAGYPLAWLLSIYGWRHSLFLLACAGIVLAIISWIVVKDTPPKELKAEVLKSHGGADAHTYPSSLLGNIIEVIRKPQSWLIAFYGFLMYIPLSGVSDMWGPTFLISAYGVDKMTAGFINSALYIGLGIGSPFFSYLCNFLKSYKLTILISALGALLMLSAVYYIPGMPLWLLTTCLFLAGFSLGGQFLAFSMAGAINPLSAAGTAAGFQNMICMLSGVLFQPFLGWLLDLSWKGNLLNGIRVYTASEYTFAFTPIIVCLFLACLCIIPIKEKYV